MERLRTALLTFTVVATLVAPSALSAQTVPPLGSSAIEKERNLRVFGLEVFRRSTSEFQLMTTGPVPASYRVGPGGELVLLLNGNVENSYVLPVTREGFIVIPQVGHVWVNGLTMDELRNQLYTQLGRAYSGVRRGPEATTQFQLTLGQLRPNQVFVTGEVAQPGTYLVHAVASTLNALYLAGGPTPECSFRDVRINRGNQMAHRLDLYEYLLQGQNLSEVRLEPGDVVFVPVHHPQVSIKGEVVRPAINEVLPDETLSDLVAFAGGFTAPAHARPARITRILPPEDRAVPGVDRITIDVDLAEVVRNPVPRAAAGARRRRAVFPVRSEVRRTVTAQGALWHPGDFRYKPGLRVWDLIEKAEGIVSEETSWRNAPLLGATLGGSPAEPTVDAADRLERPPHGWVGLRLHLRPEALDLPVLLIFFLLVPAEILPAEAHEGAEYAP